MGKHGKEEACGMCGGSGKQKASRNGGYDYVTCSGCGGSGTQ